MSKGIQVTPSKRMRADPAINETAVQAVVEEARAMDLVVVVDHRTPRIDQAERLVVTADALHVVVANS